MKRIQYFLQKYRAFILYVLPSMLAIFVVLVAFFYALSLSSTSCLSHGVWCGEDIDQYKNYSDNMLSGHGYTARKVNNMYFIPLKENVYIPETIRHPAFPFLLTIGRVFYDKAQLLLFYNYLFYIGILFFTYQISCLLLKNKWIALLILFAVSFNANMLYYTAVLGNVDTFTAFAICGFLYFFLKLFLLDKYREKSLIQSTVFASAFGTIAVMARENTPFFMLFFTGLSIMCSYIFFKNQKSRTYMITVFICVLFFVLLWSLRLFFLTDKLLIAADSGTQLFDEHIIFTLVSNNDTKKMSYWYNNTAWKYMMQLRKEGKTIPQANAIIDSRLQNMTEYYLMSHPTITFSHFLIATYDVFAVSSFNWNKPDLFLRIKSYTHRFGLASLYILILFPFLFFIIKRKDKQKIFFIGLLWFTTLSFLLLSAFFHGTIMGERAGVATLPIVIILVGFSLQTILLWINTLVKEFFLRR